MSRGTIARTIGEHWVSGPNGGTATESWCDCTCGVRITVPGGTRDQAWGRGNEHQADAVADALLSDDVIERAARAIARAENADYWVEEIDGWERLEEWEREAYPGEYPGMAYEDRGQFREDAHAALTAALGEDEQR